MMAKMNMMTKYIIAFMLVVLFLAGFIFGMNVIAGNYAQPSVTAYENVQANVMNQFAAITVLFVMGLVMLFPLVKRIGVTHVLLLSYIVGLLLFMLISALLLVMHIYFSLLTVIIVYGLMLIPIYILSLRHDKGALKINKTAIIKIAFWSLTILAVGFTLSKVPISNISFDSIQYRLLGKAYATEHYITSYFYYEMAGRTFIPSLLNGIGVFFNFDYAYALQNVFLVNSFLLFGFLLFSQTREKGFERKPSKWFAWLGLLALATSFFVLFLGITLVPNIFTAFSFCFMMVYLYRYINHKNMLDLCLSFFFMLAFSYSRVEAPLIAGFVLAYTAHKDIKAKPLIRYTGALLVFLLMWYISFSLHVGADYEGRFLTFGRSMINIALLLLVGVYIAVKQRFLNKQNDKLFVLFVCAIIVFTVALGLRDIEKMGTNIRVTYLNMFAEGQWMTAWFGVGIFAMVAMVITKKKDSFLEGFIPLYLILILAIFAFRGDNLHINWSDSGNRLLMHIYPLTVFAIADNIISLFTPVNE